jgi:hypothetical protein
MEAKGQIHSSPGFFITEKGLVEREKQIQSSVNGVQLFVWSKPHIWENSVLKT